MKLPVEKLLPLAALSLLAACGGGGTRPDPAAQMPVSTSGPSADYPMVLGAPYSVDGVTYTPSDAMNYDAVGYAALGGDGGAGVTAAHRSMPLPSYIEVTALGTGKTILARVERRGPLSGKALVELSPDAAAQLGISAMPGAEVRVRRVNPVELDRALLRTGQMAPARMDTPKSLLTVLLRKLDAQEGTVRQTPAAWPAGAVNPASAPAVELAKPVKPVKPVKGKAGPETKPAPIAKPMPASKPATALKPAAKPPVVSARGKYVVQVGAYASQANARTGAGKIGGSVATAGKLWRLSMGPYASEAEAKAALAKAKSAGYSDARIQRAN